MDFHYIRTLPIWFLSHTTITVRTELPRDILCTSLAHFTYFHPSWTSYNPICSNFYTLLFQTISTTFCAASHRYQKCHLHIHLLILIIELLYVECTSFMSWNVWQLKVQGTVGTVDTVTSIIKTEIHSCMYQYVCLYVFMCAWNV